MAITWRNLFQFFFSLFSLNCFWISVRGDAFVDFSRDPLACLTSISPGIKPVILHRNLFGTVAFRFRRNYIHRTAADDAHICDSPSSIRLRYIHSNSMIINYFYFLNNSSSWKKCRNYLYIAITYTKKHSSLFPPFFRANSIPFYCIVVVPSRCVTVSVH